MDIYKRLVIGFIFVAFVLFFGAVGYYLLGHGNWSFSDCLYMTVITISTVGFSEVIDVAAFPGARLYTIVIILFGMGVIIFFGSTVVAFIVEGELKQYFRSRRMEKIINKLTHHIIVCGAGFTGMYIIKELLATKTPFLVIDENEEHIRHVEEETEAFPYIIGDASDDNVLLEARIQHARGLIASLPEDKDNLLVVVTARQLSQKLRIISRGIDPTIADKLKRAGADAVVSSNFIGGMRMVSEMIRPNVVEFLDLMLKDKDKNLRVEEVPINASSPCADNTLEQCNVRKSSNVLVVAAKDVEGNYIHNPESDFILHEGSALIVLGPVEEVNKLRSALKCV